MEHTVLVAYAEIDMTCISQIKNKYDLFYTQANLKGLLTHSLYCYLP